MDIEYKRVSAWHQLDEKEYEEVYAYAERYKKYLNVARTERLAVKEIVRQAQAKGFKNLEEAESFAPGDKLYAVNNKKMVALYVLGQEDLEKGLNIVGSHVDIPRLDLKMHPFYEAGELALAKTHYYGGIKKYQWTTIPLSLYGFVVTKEGKEIEVAIGNKEGDPVFFIADLIAHLSKDQGQKKMAEGIAGEDLNIVVGHSRYTSYDAGQDRLSEDGSDKRENPIKKNILYHLKEEYGIEEEDFVSAEFQAVFQGEAKDVGFDRAMIAATGHDDQVCSYASLEAILEVEKPKKTAVSLFVDKEEIGSVGNTSMESSFFENTIMEIMLKQGKNEVALRSRRVLANSHVLSADVTAALNPNFPEVMDKYNACYAGHGVGIAKYTGHGGKFGCNDANPEFVAQVRRVFADNQVAWQTGELGKVDQGGGGTIAFILANHGAQVLDVGTPVLSMHAPVELVSKVDAYMTKKAYHAFLK